MFLFRIGVPGKRPLRILEDSQIFFRLSLVLSLLGLLALFAVTRRTRAEPVKIHYAAHLCSVRVQSYCWWDASLAASRF